MNTPTWNSFIAVMAVIGVVSIASMVADRMIPQKERPPQAVKAELPNHPTKGDRYVRIFNLTNDNPWRRPIPMFVEIYTVLEVRGEYTKCFVTGVDCAGESWSREEPTHSLFLSEYQKVK